MIVSAYYGNRNQNLRKLKGDEFMRNFIINLIQSIILSLKKSIKKFVKRSIKKFIKRFVKSIKKKCDVYFLTLIYTYLFFIFNVLLIVVLIRIGDIL